MSKISDLVGQFEGLKEQFEGLGTQTTGYIQEIDEAIEEAAGLGVGTERLEAAKARAEELMNEISSLVSSSEETASTMGAAGEPS